MSDILMTMFGIFIGLFIIDLIIEYRAYKKRQKSHKKGKFLTWF